MTAQRRVAVITGAASGIGLALAKNCLDRGFHVVMADSDITTLQMRTAELMTESSASILAVECDVTHSDSLQTLANQTMAEFKRVDWLFNNAGISGKLAPIWELTDRDVRSVLDVNLHGIIYGIQAFLPHLFLQNHRSHIINISSLYGLCSGSQMSSYAMSKHAVLALSESLYFDLQRLEKPVNVSVACPSFVSTNLLANPLPAEADNSLRETLNELIERSRPACDIAEYIIEQVEKDVFYILPDKEVKEYCEQRTRAIVEELPPHKYSIEKIIAALSKRVGA